MSKKNKKNIVTNQKIKYYFDGDPFDVGAARVDSKTLSELFATLGIYGIDQSKEMLLKTIRMVWSEGDGEFRQEILNFFASHGQIYKSSNTKEVSLQRDEKIDSLILELDVTQEEAAILRGSFEDVRSKKITIEKMESKLLHIRFDAKKRRIQKKVDGIFDIDDSLEFNASLKYAIYGDSFHKIITLNTKIFDYNYLKEADEEAIFEEILREKSKSIQNKQQEIDNFLKNLPLTHLYLTQKEIISSLRASPPKTKLAYPPLKQSIIESVISAQLGQVEVEMHDDEVLVRLEQSLTLAHSQRVHNYILELNIELNSLLDDIWNSHKLDFEQIIEESKKEQEEQFYSELTPLVKECNACATLLHLRESNLYEKVYGSLLDLLPQTLYISPKIYRKTLKRFAYDIHDEIVKKQRYELLARTIRNFKDLFPIARGLRRKLTLHIGPTNSGKTYQAMQKLQKADTGYYLAPLRLLALEGYEELKKDGINSSLITGEEQILDDDATHISSTIEMLNFEVDVDVCIIDEVQMIDDRDRGWAWANAIIGAPAKEVIMTGSQNVKESIISLAKYLGEELEIIEFERKNPLTLLEHATYEKDVEKGSAIIAFSRRDVLKLKQNFSKYFDVSVVYGNLSPEVRREEARRFRAGETTLLIATDAIAMGMNLPIKTILFSKAMKFDGISDRNLFPNEIHQIAGRAGRFGLHEEGFVGALTPDVLKIVKRGFHKEAKTITTPFKVMANLEHVKLVTNILEEKSLREILKFFVKNMEFDGPFIATNLDDMLEVSIIVDQYDLDIATKYHLACAPLTLKSPYIMRVYENYLESLEKKMPISYIMPALQGERAYTSDELLRAEDMVKEISLYLWLSYKFDDYFKDYTKAYTSRGILNKYIEKSLQQNQLALKCKLCKAPLPLNSAYAICQSCFKNNKIRTRQQSPR